MSAVHALLTDTKITYKTGNVDAVLLVTTAHGEVLIEGVELVLGVTLWNSLLN